ncbi:glucose-1-phosphate adenylyltransferase subunit GlgD [Companilactobacillus allii]|uniref:Glucose-1-phosphate adenylyltransferase subunit GlgD n=1 Tax=Companilactobacillus allii TaxID=1847728 RepID=A0A1P8Q1E8_9LACO|nr:glucose-1-phosphate adenylyltransferase subunit GlgD [Companilactobacillus allii]APX71703.1 glucose-1-phosphate adenylyltransferase subunit GlgD [Companilactobacillus allii]USQ68791.1 glucose-1-phosphate adenylyltransferase subunit GlgD [Companilactobacillus allii]
MKHNTVSAIINLVEPWEELKSLTENRPVGTLPFGGRYRLIDFPLSSIANAGIRNVMITSPRSGRSVADHLRSGNDWNLDTIRGGLFNFPYNDLSLVSPEKKEALIHHYYDNTILFLKRSNSEYSVVMGTRNICNIDLAALLRYHKERDNPVTTVYKSVDAKSVDPDTKVLQVTDNGMATAVVAASNTNVSPNEDGKLAKSLNIYLMSTVDLIDILNEANMRGELISLERLMLRAVIQHNANAFEYTGFYANIHDIGSYYDASMSILGEDNFRALFYSQRRIYTKVKNEIPTFFAKSSQVKGSLCGTGGYIEGQIKHSVIFRNVLINRNSKITNSVIMQGTRIGAGTTIENVIIDKNVVVGPNLQLKGTPENPLVIGKGKRIFRQTEVENV